jgi:hypothetical protein
MWKIGFADLAEQAAFFMLARRHVAWYNRES